MVNLFRHIAVGAILALCSAVVIVSGCATPSSKVFYRTGARPVNPALDRGFGLRDFPAQRSQRCAAIGQRYPARRLSIAGAAGLQ